MDNQLKIFEREIEELLLESQMNMKKLTINNIQLSDLMKASVNELQSSQNQSIQDVNQQIKQCLIMQDEFLQIEALQKKIQIFRILCEDIVKNKEQEFTQLQKMSKQT